MWDLGEGRSKGVLARSYSLVELNERRLVEIQAFLKKRKYILEGKWMGKVIFAEGNIGEHEVSRASGSVDSLGTEEHFGLLGTKEQSLC